MKIVSASDLHGNTVEISPCDLFLYAGDYGWAYSSQVKDFNKWVSTIPCKYVVGIGGNHDRYAVQPDNKLRKYLTNIIYLENSGVTIDGVKIWGSPYTPPFGNWFFMAGAEEREKYWNMIPDDTQILITHGPPYEILDEVTLGYNTHVGDSLLLKRIKELENLRLCVFGHIHTGYGMIEKDGVIFINAALCNDFNYLVNKPIEIELPM